MSQNTVPKTFLTVWAGQLASLIGTGLTNFAITVWVYQSTGDVTELGLVLFSLALPAILLSPIAGVVADRFDRRLVMMAADTGAALITVTLAVLFYTGNLEVWHLYLTSAASATCNTFQLPAYFSSIPLLVPKRHLGRANGLVQTATAGAQIVAPLAGGVLVEVIGVGGVLVIDLATFGIAVGALALVSIPRPEGRDEVDEPGDPLLRKALAGWRYVREHPGFMGLLVFFSVTNFLAGMVTVLGTPLVLAIADPATLGVVSAVGGAGLLVGSLTMSAWGGPKRLIYGVLGFELVSGVAIALAGVRPSPILFAIGGFGFLFCMPIISGSSEAIWQRKVKPALQGRVFAIRKVLASAARPLAYLAAGPLADRLFEPLLAPGGALASTVGQVIGTGEGRGIGFLFIVLGGLTLVATAVGFATPRIRNLEDEVPDAVSDEPPESEAGGDSGETEPGTEAAEPTPEEEPKSEPDPEPIHA